MDAFATLLSPAHPPRLFLKAAPNPPLIGASYDIPAKAKAPPKAKALRRAKAPPKEKAPHKEKVHRAEAPTRGKQPPIEKVTRMAKETTKEKAPRKTRAQPKVSVRTNIYIIPTHLDTVDLFVRVN